MRIGFTGTRHGMTIDQWAKVGNLLADNFVRNMTNEWHDGDCLGADAQAHGSVEQVQKMFPEFNIITHGHPCNKPNWRAYKEFDILHEIRPPLVRNRVIVESSELMIAAPQEYDEQHRGSGTWATIRYAERQKKNLIIVWPDGSVSEKKPKGLLDISTGDL